MSQPGPDKYRQTADKYRQNAEDCRWNADRAPADEKDRWLKVAADWEKLAEELDQRSPDRQGGEKRKADALLAKRAPAAFCDDCIAKQIGIGPSQVNPVTLTLGLTTDFRQMMGTCSVCEREKLVTSRRTQLTC